MITHVYKNLFISNCIDAQNEQMLQQVGIHIVINLSAECDYRLNKRFQYHRFAMPDSINLSADQIQYVYKVWEYIRQTAQNNPNRRILVHCLAGISRSAAAIAYVIMCDTRISYVQALALMRTKKYVQPNMLFVEMLQELE